jgi:Ribbon-helix-helix protein, copG family
MFPAPDVCLNEFVRHVVYGLCETSLLWLAVQLVQSILGGPDGRSILKAPKPMPPLKIWQPSPSGKLIRTSLHLLRSQLRKVDEIAKDTGQSRAEVVRMLVDEALRK